METSTTTKAHSTGLSSIEVAELVIMAKLNVIEERHYGGLYS
jgi:hypothetical protein